MAYEGLLFSFAEMEREIENFKLSADKFLETNSTVRLIPQWLRELRTFRGRDPGTRMTWEISERHPIETIISEGKFDRRASMKVFGRVSAVWEISLPSEERAPKKGTLRNAFIVNGLASTRVSIWKLVDGSDPKEIARWTVEIGDETSPGCHFHSQIPLEDDGCGMFPKALPVPRLPTLFVTPMDALEFVLAELFQEDWNVHSSKSNGSRNAWASCQRQRIQKLLDWYLERVGSSTSPWLALKQGKPLTDTLIK